MKSEEMKIVEYKPEHQPYFEQFNRVWIEQYFKIEPMDEFVLTKPDQAILKDGGAILMAEWNGELIGNVALKKQQPGIFELTKMTISEAHRGRGFGEMLCRAAIMKGKSLGAKKVVLYSNTKLRTAIQLYRKLGFREAYLEPGIYLRCDIKMQIDIDKITILPADEAAACLISEIGRKSFGDAFRPFFKRMEDLLNYLDHTYNHAKVLASIRKPNNAFFLAFLNGEAAGFVKLKKKSVNKHLDSIAQTELQKIYVLREFHGLGPGDKLMEASLKFSADLGTTHLWLDVIIENERAIQFYKKYGFTRMGHHNFRIGSQDFNYHVMARSIHIYNTNSLSAQQDHREKT